MHGENLKLKEINTDILKYWYSKWQLAR